MSADEAPEADVDPAAPPAATDSAAPSEPHPGSREARYRRRARDAEARVEALEAENNTFRRADVEREAGRRLHDPGDLWRSGVELADMVNDEGVLDLARVNEAVSRVAAEHPHWLKAAPDFDAGVRGGLPERPSFGEALKGR